MIVDTDVIVAAIRSSTGASAEIVRQILKRERALELSVALALEYEAVATRDEHVSASDGDIGDVLNTIDAMIAVATLIDVHFRWRPQLRDPDDEMVLEAAINAEDRTIVTFNVRDFAGAAERFKIRVLTPRQFLEAAK